MGTKSLGVMLDMSRNAVMKPDEIKKFANYIAKMGYNALYLYTEETYEIEGEPYFGHLRGRYSKAEIKDLDSYLKKIGIELIPCIQTLAHLNNIFKWEKYDSIHDLTDILLIGEEKTYELIEKMFRSWRECVSTDKINIGMDEAYLVGRGKYIDIHGKAEERFELVSKHLKRVLEIARKYGFEASMWSDMFLRAAAPYYYDRNISFEKLASIKHLVPDDVTLIYWDYYHDDKEFYDTYIDAHRVLTDKVSMACGATCWQGFAPYNKGAIKRSAYAIDSCFDRKIDTVIVTMWGDDGAECSFFAMLPTLLSIAERMNGNTDTEKLKADFYELVGVPFDDFLKLDYPNSAKGNVWEYQSKLALYNDPFIGKFDYHIKNGDGNEYRAFAEELAEAKERAGEFAYIFDCMEKFCKVLEFKFDLGVRTREAYLSGNKAELADIAGEIYPALIERLEEFYLSFENQWSRENKPEGFEVQDVRFGGLLQRLKHCRKILSEYLLGRSDSIPELENEVLPYRAASETFGGMSTPYNDSVSACNL